MRKSYAMITTLFFDIDNTLLDFTACSKDSMRRVFSDYGLPFDDGKFATFTAFNNMLWGRVERGELTKDGLFEIRWNMIFRALGIAGVDGREFEKAFHEYLGVSCVKMEGAEDALAYLSRKYKLYAASNAPADQQPKRMQLAGLGKYMSGYFISENIGYPKPDKRFYDECFKRLAGVAPSEVMMIGDSLSADIDGAKRYGMHTCWLTTDKAPANCADLRVQNLAQLRDVL